MIKKILFASILCLLFCCTTDTNEIAVDSIVLNKTELQLIVGQTEQLSYVITPSNVKDPNIVWSTEDKTIAQVSNTGLITAVSIGTTKIIATISNKKFAEVNVTVNSPGVWENLNDLTEGCARYGSVSFAIGNKGYIGLGSNFQYVRGSLGSMSSSSGDQLNDFWSYDFKTKIWSPVTAFPGSPREKAVGFSVNNKAYIGLGEYNHYVKIGDRIERYPLKDFWEYDPLTNKWTQLPDFPGGERSNSIGFALNGNGYVGLGDNENSKKFSDDFWRFDPSINLWTQLPNFPGGIRSEAVGFAIDNKAYVGLGRTDYYTSPSLNSDFWSFDPTLNTWTKKADMPIAPLSNGYYNWAEKGRASANAFSINGKGYVGNGYSKKEYTPFASDFQNANDFWEYNPTTDVWIQKQNSLNYSSYTFVFNNSTNGFFGGGEIYTQEGNHGSKVVLTSTFHKFTP